MRTALVWSAACALALAACGSEDGGGSDVVISNLPVTGVVGGAPWTFLWGATDAYLSEGEDDFFAELSSEAGTCRGSSFGDGLLLSVPRQLGDYPLSLARNVTFVVGDDNLIATEGHIVVEDVTGTFLRGGIHVRYDDDNEVNGRFTLTVCE
jgi:hypothetical protein